MASLSHSDLLNFNGRLYFIGILGSGMLPLAELCRSLGLEVTGSDTGDAKHDSLTICPQDGTGLKAEDIVVYSTAISPNNLDRRRAEKLSLPQVHRYELLMLLFSKNQTAIAVSGTHGKTSTTTMIAELLARLGKEPGYFAGGQSVYFNGGSKAPVSSLDRLNEFPFVYEADESDGSFLKSKAAFRIITNIDADHLENYGNDYQNLLDSFYEFGIGAEVLIVCGDDTGVRKLIPRWQEASVRLYTYGYDEPNDLKITTKGGFESTFQLGSIFAASTTSINIELPMPAPHYHRNFAAALILGLMFELDPLAVGDSLASYQGVARRLQYYGSFQKNNATVSVYDDYGHHPTELAAVIASLQRSGEPVLVLFQPHRFSRTKALAPEFARALGAAEYVVLLPIYSAGESQIEGVSHNTIADHFKNKSKLYIAGSDWQTKDWEQVLGKFVGHSKVSVLTLGAGDVYRILTTLPGNPFEL